MKKFTSLFFALLLVAGLSCKKSQTTATTLTITITDGSNSIGAAAATVYLYDSAAAVTSNTPKYTVTADQNGIATITITFSSQYFVIAQKAGQKNYYNGLIPVGTFKSTTDVQDSPAQTPPGIVGGVKFQDTNGDGAITTADDVPPPAVTIKANTANSFNATIY